jgi:predicted nucleic-acid-binding Zn-ribbon protein
MLPDLNNCNFFKKTAVSYGDKTEKTFIFKLKPDADYTFVFDCPKCSGKNEFKGQLVMKEIKEDGKKKKYITFECKKCGCAFTVEKFKVKAYPVGKEIQSKVSSPKDKKER